MSKEKETWVDWNNVEYLQQVINISRSRVEVLKILNIILLRLDAIDGVSRSTAYCTLELTEMCFQATSGKINSRVRI